MNPVHIFNKTLGNNRNSNKKGKKYNQKQKAKSVLEAKRIHSGTVTVLGTIVSLSDLYVVVSKTKWHRDNKDYCNFNGEMSHNPPLSLPMTSFDSTDEKPILCPKCKSTGFSVILTHKDAKFVQLEDTEKTDENERLDVIVYADLTKGLVAGEVVEMTGSIRVQRKAENSKSKKLVNVLHAKSIDYVNRVKVTVTNNDIKNFFKWKDICDRTYQTELKAINRYNQYPQCPECCKWAGKIIPMTFKDRLVAMFAPDVIGQEEAKLGILRSAVGGIEEGGRRGRINTLLVGDPGTAKSKIIRAATEIKPNSRYVNAQNSSTKSLMAIVDRENDSLVLRLGPIPLSKHAICAINELNQMTLDDQARLVDVLEEGRFNKGAYGLWFEIESPTTIIASANPINATWEDTSAISNDEVLILKNLLDRFDQIFGFRDNFTEKEAQSFAEKMSLLRKKDKHHNHNFLRKYLVYASGLEVKITPEADYMLNKFWVKGKVSVTMKNRMYAAIFRIAEAQARLHIRNEVDDDIANQSMESIQYMIKQYGKVIQKITSPSDALYNTFLQILQNSKDGMTIYEICRRASEENEQIAAYLDERWSIENNHKLRPIIELLLNHDKVKKISIRPMVLRWVVNITENAHSDISDQSDVKKQGQTYYPENNSERSSDASYRSDVQEDNILPDYITGKDLRASDCFEIFSRKEVK